MNTLNNQLNDLLTMIDRKMDLFLIKACAKSCEIDLASESLDDARGEVEEIIAHLELEQESESLSFTF